MRGPANEETAKKRLRSTLRYPESVFAEIWAQLIESGAINSYSSGDLDWADLISDARQLHREALNRDRLGEKIAQADRRQGRSRTDPAITALGVEEGHRGIALGGYLAMLANDRPAVQAFRTQHFAGEVLSNQRALDFLGSRKHASSPRKSNGRTKHLLLFKPWASSAQAIEVGAGSPLDELRILSLNLSEEFLWDAGEACWFVLTGTVPRADPISLNRSNHYVLFGAEKKNEEQEVAVRRSRITITADDWVSVETVARLYRSIQKMGSRTDRRALSSKSLSLFMFVNRLRSRRKDRIWEEIRREWNEIHRDEPRMRISSFRSLSTTYKRVLHEVAFGPSRKVRRRRS